MKRTKQVRKVIEIATLLRTNPKTTAADVMAKYSCSKNYAYILLQKARAHRPKARMQSAADYIAPEVGSVVGGLKLTDVGEGKLRWVKEPSFIDSVPLVGETLAMLPPDMVNSPPHYKIGGIEAIDYIQAKLTPEEFRGYLKGNVLKYTSRAGYKEDAGKDVDKMVWYALKLQSLK